VALAVGFALLFTVATWVPLAITPTNGLDASWTAGLAMVFVHHIAWGPNMDFTYGPLGFLTQSTLFFGSTAAMATAYLVLVDVAMFTLLILWWRRTFPLVFALLLSYVIGATAAACIDPGDRIMVPITLLGLWLLRRQEQRWQRLGIVALGVLAGVALLGKVSDGLFATIVLVVVALAGQDRKRALSVALAVGSLGVTTVVAWLALGNSLENLPQFLRYTVALSSGYSSAMQLESGRTLEWWLAGLIAVLVLVAAITSLRFESRRLRLGYAAILVMVTWWALKEGFVRHDSHDLLFFGFMLTMLSTLPASSLSGRRTLATTVALSTIGTWIAIGAVPVNLYQIPHDANALRSQITTVVSPGQRETTVNDARRSMRKTYRIDKAQLRHLRGETVAIQPWEDAVAWAYPSMIWDPEPVLQAYAAYTSSLDQLDTSFLQSNEAPSRILEQPGESVDGRYPYFEPPSTWVAMTCRYTELDASQQWEILQRVPDRCGAVTPVARATAAFGQRVAVPPAAPGTAIVARFTNLPVTVRYKLSSLLLKPPTASIDTSAGAFRFIIGTAGDLHLMRPSSTLGYSAGYVPASLNWFALRGAGVGSGQGRYDVTFYEIPMALH
jgi:hypothetical protein